METAFRNLRRLPFATILAARNYGMDNISVPETAQSGAKLCMAILRGDNIEAQELLDEGCPLDHHDDPDGWTPLIYSIYYNNRRARNMLLSRGADISEPDYAMRTPLMFAAIRGDADLLSALLCMGADPGQTDYRGKSALDFAMEYHNRRCADILMFHR